MNNYIIIIYDEDMAEKVIGPFASKALAQGYVDAKVPPSEGWVVIFPLHEPLPGIV